MASAPGGGDRGDSTDQILEVGAILLKDFIYQRLRRHEDQNLALIRHELDGRELTDPKLKELGQCLQKIGDELDSNVKFNELMTDVAPTNEMFLKVAREIFSDGKFNWGRVVALFYFACRLVIKALARKMSDIIKTIISWTLNYLREHLVNWIREQGGWEGIRAYFGTPTWQTVAVFLAGVVTAVIVVRKM